MSKLDFSWSYSDTNNPNVFFRLYENGVKAVDNIGDLKFTLLMDGKAPGGYDYYVTAVSQTTLLESVPSNTVHINFTKPAAPTGLKGSLTA